MEKEQIIPELERITIGRAVDNRVVLTPTNISRRHAIITIVGSNVFLLEEVINDKGESNRHGTYVNSEKIHRKFISAEDKIKFANNEYLAKEILEMAKIIQPSSKAPKENDYTEEFEKMKELWEQYQIFISEEINIKNAIERMTEDLKMAGATAPLTIMALSLIPGVAGASFITMIGACGLGMLIPAIGSKFLGKKEKLIIPRLNFANNWKCPKCGDKTGLLNKSWEALAKQKKCTKCDAVWVK